MTTFCNYLKKHMWAKVLTAILLGVLVGFLMRMFSIGNNLIDWLALPGYIFLAVIKMIVVPLVLTAVVTGIAGGDDAKFIKNLGAKVVLYFVITTSIAISIGSGLATLIEPGSYLNAETMKQTLSNTQLPSTLSAFKQAGDNLSIPKQIANIIPTNPLAAATKGEMLQLVIFAAILGLALLSMKKSAAKPVLDFANSLLEACMLVVKYLMNIVPVAVFGLIAEMTFKIGTDAINAMAIYMATVILGLASMIIVYMVILKLFTLKNPIEFLQQAREVQMLAFSTSSSSATMPVTLQTTKEIMKIKDKVANLVIPLGTTINMDGTALYQAVASIFLAQVFGIDLHFSDMLIILITAIGASVGTPGVPGVGLIILATILISIGVPIEGIALLLGVDRILDMLRTTLNVTGDMVAAHVMDAKIKD